MRLNSSGFCSEIVSHQARCIFSKPQSRIQRVGSAFNTGQSRCAEEGRAILIEQIDVHSPRDRDLCAETVRSRVGSPVASDCNSIDVECLLDHPLDGVLKQDSLAGSLPEPLTEVLVPDEPTHRVHQCRDIAWRNENPVRARSANDLRNATNIRSDYRQRTRHRLREHERGRLASLGRKEEDIGRGEILRKDLVRLPADEVNALLDSE
jgi:hypothetical protein